MYDITDAVNGMTVRITRTERYGPEGMEVSYKVLATWCGMCQRCDTLAEATEWATDALNSKARMMEISSILARVGC